MKHSALTLAVAAVTLIVSGCGNSESEGEPSSSVPAATKPSVAVSVSPPATQVNQGRSEVKFDPCVDIGDDTIEKAGYDPRSRKREDFAADNYTFLSCWFKSQDPASGLTAGYLTVRSSNIALSEFRDRYGATVEEAKVASRDAIIFEESGTCNLAMTSQDGTLSLQVDVGAMRTDQKLCDRVVEDAKVIEPLLD